MKRCPTCNKTFTDLNLSFCVDDGTPLVTVEPPDDETTVVRPSARADEDRSIGSSGLPASGRYSADERAASVYQPPYIPPGSRAQGRRRTWPWLVGILVVVVLVLGGLAIAAVMLVPGMLRTSTNKNNANLNANVEHRNLNAKLENRNSNSSQINANTNSIADASMPPPTDREAVLTELKNLEGEWTVANINADKNKLNRILADDYVGITNGRAQGKAEYLKTIEPDTSIQHWEFGNLSVSLNGDRASLTGTIRLDVKDENGQDKQLTFQFTDKFVWRDARWQATSSEVNPVKAPGSPV